MRLYDCKTIEDVAQLPRDGSYYGDFWFLTDGYTVSLHEQKLGESSSQSISIPRHVFNHFVREYMKERK